MKSPANNCPKCKNGYKEMTNRLNEKIKQILALAGESNKHEPLKNAMIQLQVLLDWSDAKDTLLPDMHLYRTMIKVIDNYLIKLNSDDDFVNELLVIINDMSSEQVECLAEIQLSIHNRAAAVKPTPREQFEYDLKRINKKVNLDRSQDGGYCNQYIEMAWSLQRNIYFRITGNLAARRKVHGPYYVARRDENSRLNFSEIPTPHKSYGRAEAEAKRLANKTKFNFTVLNEVGTYGPDTE